MTAPSTPPDTVIYAIGDVHGRCDLLELLTSRITADATERRSTNRLLILLGDYVSRGVDSRRVIEMLLAPPPAGFKRITLRGNHEDLWLRYLEGDLDAGRRVLAVDPFYFGECAFKDHGYLWALMVGTIGERPLGLQAGQIAGVARWAAERDGVAPTVVAVGPRTSTIALVAAALEEKAIAGVALHEPLGSLKELIESSREFSASPELFCFGLLESFDLKQVAALVAPRPVELHRASDRAKAELSRK